MVLYFRALWKTSHKYSKFKAHSPTHRTVPNSDLVLSLTHITCTHQCPGCLPSVRVTGVSVVAALDQFVVGTIHVRQTLQVSLRRTTLHKKNWIEIGL